MDSEFSKISFFWPSTRPNERDKSGGVNRGTRAVSGITPYLEPHTNQIIGKQSHKFQN